MKVGGSCRGKRAHTPKEKGSRKGRDGQFDNISVDTEPKRDTGCPESWGRKKLSWLSPLKENSSNAEPWVQQRERNSHMERSLSSPLLRRVTEEHKLSAKGTSKLLAGSAFQKMMAMIMNIQQTACWSRKTAGSFSIISSGSS